MLQSLRRARLIWPTALTIVGLAVLIGLGTWQLQRKQWKDALIAKIAERVGAAPISLARAEQIWRDGGDVEYLHVQARGRFHHDKERYLYAPATSGLGWHVYTPLELGPARFVWVNRGFVPDARKAPAARAEGQPAGEIEVRGLVRAPARKGLFTPENDVAHNLWYWPEVAAMTTSAFPGDSVQGLPVVIDADAGPAPPGGLPRGGVTRLDLPNRHLEYALTWYGLALTLIGVYSAFAISRLRAPASV
jgi:surfeit locus 1 family protein